MAAPKTLTGGRAVVSVEGQIVGLFESCTYGPNLGAEAIHTLGRFGPQEIVVNSAEAITLRCSGFRIIDQGAHVLPKFPKLQDLLNLGTVSLSIRDRQSGKLIANALGCVPISYDTGVNARATSRMNVTYLATKLTDESGDQEEGGAVNLP